MQSMNRIGFGMAAIRAAASSPHAFSHASRSFEVGIFDDLGNAVLSWKPNGFDRLVRGGWIVHRVQ